MKQNKNPSFKEEKLLWEKGYKYIAGVDEVGRGAFARPLVAASVIAKVYRDNLMRELHEQYFMYNFLENKGYGTKFHREALKKYGLSEVHRTSFDLQKFLSYPSSTGVITGL